MRLRYWLHKFSRYALAVAIIVIAVAVGWSVAMDQGVVGNNSDKMDIDHNETSLTINITADHDSDVLFVRHPENDEYIVASQELDPFATTVSIDPNRFRCDDAKFPDTTFEVAIATFNEEGDGPVVATTPLTGKKTEIDASQTVTLSDELVNGECTEYDL